MNEDKDNKDKESPESGQAYFPTEIAEVDGFIADMLERYGADVGDSLFAGDSLFRDGVADLLGATLTGEQLPYLKPSPLARNSDVMRPSDSLSFGLGRGFLPDEDETLNRYCRFIAIVPDANMRMSVRYSALALLRYSFPNEVRLSYSIRNVIDDLG